MSKTFKTLELEEISFVDRPAQTPAIATILKSENGALAVEIAKRWIDPQDGAVSFGEVMTNAAKDKAYWEAQEIVCPAINALDTSLRSIAGDVNLSQGEKEAMAAQGVMEFMNTFRELLPEVESEVVELVQKASTIAGNPVSKAEESMTDTTEQVAKLQDELATVRKQLEEAEAVSKMSDAEKAYMSGMDEKAKAEFMKMSAADRKARISKAAETDETVTFKGATVRKSAVGAEMFAIVKAQADELETVRKAQEEAVAKAETAELEKRAASEFGNLPGTPAEIAGVLKALNGNEKGEAILKAANASLAKAFEAQGVGDGRTVRKSSDVLETKVSEVMKAQGISRAKAMEAVAKSNPELVEAN